MKVYHVTRTADAAAISTRGFHDRRGRYLTNVEHAGVWVADRPLIVESGLADFACFEIEIDEERLRDFEWLEASKSYREWLMPAELLNQACCRQLTESEALALI
jgi:hypothetical protein